MYESFLTPPERLFRQFQQWSREVDDAFGVAGQPGSIRSSAPGAWPAVNVGRTATALEVYAFAPGLEPSKIEVTFERGVLRIAGERAPAPFERSSKVSVYARERGCGSFSRAVALPEDADGSKVSATYRNGVLQISVPLRETAQPKRIAVQ